MRPQNLTTAKTVAKISVVSNTAGRKKGVARADPQVLTIPPQHRLRLPAPEDVDAAGVDQVGTEGDPSTGSRDALAVRPRKGD
jgi:hypothetical protein